MTLDEVTALFPERGLALYRVERGPPDGRRLIWKASWSAGYFTSDTDRHVQHSYGQEFFGHTAGAALDALVRNELESAEARVRAETAALQEAEQELAKVSALIGDRFGAEIRKP